MKIKFRNPSNGLCVECPTGFSWTTFFGGLLVPAVRYMWGFTAICTIAVMLTFGLAWLVLPFIINKHYAKFLLEKGYKPVGEADVQAIKQMGLMFDFPEERQQKAA